DTDLFQPLMKRAAELCGVDFQKEEDLEEGKGGAASLRVISDHARATAFLVADGVTPSNDGRGYVLRKIMRRAIRHGRLLGATQPILADMVDAVKDLMGNAYPELRESRAPVPLVSRLQLPLASSTRPPDVVSAEEKRFAATLDTGLSKLIGE